MKTGVSLYSLSRAIKANEMTVTQAIEWTADKGAEHVEIVPCGFSLAEDRKLLDAIVATTARLGMAISSYTIGANFVRGTDAEFRAEIERVKKEVDIAAALGVKRMRHDVAYRPPEEATLANFEKDLPFIVEACREVADRAAKHGIVTSIENHGYHVQHFDRVQRVIDQVNRENFKTTLDIGNFVVVDLNPLAGVRKNAPLASMVHVKDFYLRDAKADPGKGWGKTLGGNYFRGAIVGHGDIDIKAALKLLKDVGYDGYLSLEFEGMEDCRAGVEIGLENLKRFVAELG